MIKKTPILFLFSTLLLLMGESVSAQETATVASDTLIYQRIENISKKNKLATYIYQLIFRPVVVNAIPKKAKKKKKAVVAKNINTFDGKIIRNIYITTLDPFGYSTEDTTSWKKNILYKIGNGTHIKSKRITIKNLLLFSENQPFETLRYKESERLVRSQPYVNTISFGVFQTGKNSDSVDIFIKETDNWSIIPSFDASTTKAKINITEKNFAGLGHEFKNDATWLYPINRFAFNTNYYIPNIRNSYISTTLRYSINEHYDYNRMIAFDRPFFSPLAKWAAGASINQQFYKNLYLDSDTLVEQASLKYIAKDYWLGKAFQIIKGNTEKSKTTNLIVALRMYRINYAIKPTIAYDPYNAYANEILYLAAVGVSSRKYVQDKYIFKHGVIEDVPIGNVYSITGGYQLRDNIYRPYIGVKLSFGRFFPWGYFNPNFEYGTFVHHTRAEQALYLISINYFTKLMSVGKLKIRQFIKPHLTFGVNRMSHESISLNDGYGLDGFNSNTLTGTTRATLTFQTQTYIPWSFIGFHFGPFVTYAIGVLGNQSSGFKNSKAYTQLSIGVLIKNENLVFNKFQVSLSFYPIIPGVGENVFKPNGYKTSDFGFRDFEISKPAPVSYQ